MEEFFERIFERWKILNITYADDERTKERYRLVLFQGFMTYKGARKAAKRREFKDTMEGNFREEYVVIRNVI